MCWHYWAERNCVGWLICTRNYSYSVVCIEWKINSVSEGEKNRKSTRWRNVWDRYIDKKQDSYSNSTIWLLTLCKGFTYCGLVVASVYIVGLSASEFWSNGRKKMKKMNSCIFVLHSFLTFHVCVCIYIHTFNLAATVTGQDWIILYKMEVCGLGKIERLRHFLCNWICYQDFIFLYFCLFLSLLCRSQG